MEIASSKNLNAGAKILWFKKIFAPCIFAPAAAMRVLRDSENDTLHPLARDDRSYSKNVQEP